MDNAKIEQGVRLILEGIGEDPDREGLLDTPARVARMYEEVFAGLTGSMPPPNTVSWMVASDVTTSASTMRSRASWASFSMTWSAGWPAGEKMILTPSRTSP